MKISTGDDKWVDLQEMKKQKYNGQSLVAIPSPGLLVDSF